MSRIILPCKVKFLQKSVDKLPYRVYNTIMSYPVG
nr:MAG TPA: hypothetical protein [Caudoviricetes sp.]